jgi:hypothetical protein
MTTELYIQEPWKSQDSNCDKSMGDFLQGQLVFMYYYALVILCIHLEGSMFSLSLIHGSFFPPLRFSDGIHFYRRF